MANELDGWNGTDRNHIDVFVPQQDLADSYLPSFQTCVEQGKVSGIMCSCEFRGLSAPWGAATLTPMPPPPFPHSALEPPQTTL